MQLLKLLRAGSRPVFVPDRAGFGTLKRWSCENSSRNALAAKERGERCTFPESCGAASDTHPSHRNRDTDIALRDTASKNIGFETWLKPRREGRSDGRLVAIISPLPLECRITYFEAVPHL